MPILGTAERRSGPFQRLWTTTATNNLADGVLRLVTPVGAVGLGATPAQVAVVVAAQTAPWLILSPASGLVADRHPPHLIIRCASVLRALACLGLLEALDSTGTPIALLAVCAAALGSAEVVADITAQTAVPDIVSDDELEWAYGRIKATQIAGDTLVGPALGGLLLGLNATATVATAIGLFAVGAATVPRVHDRQRASGQGSVGSQLADGWKATWDDPWIRRALLTVAAMNAGAVASATALIAYAVEPGPLGLTEPQYGALMGAAGLGAAAGGPVAAKLAQTLPPRTLIQVGMFGHVIMLAAPVPSQQPALISALLACRRRPQPRIRRNRHLDAPATCRSVHARTSQRLVPDHRRWHGTRRRIGSGNDDRPARVPHDIHGRRHAGIHCRHQRSALGPQQPRMTPMLLPPH